MKRSAVKNGKPWTEREREREILRQFYPHEANARIAEYLGRPDRAVAQYARTMGLHKSAEYLAVPGAAGRFGPGHVPANKGLRRPGWAVGRMRETQFKPGQRSGMAARNWMPVGSTRLIEGYLYRKTSDIPNVPYTRNWRLEHILRWTAAHGPVPAGHAVCFRDGDRTHIALDNLELVSRADLMRRNTIHKRVPPELKAAIQHLGRLRRRIHRSEKEQQ